MYSVSVIIPFFRVGRFIQRCIGSLMSQTIKSPVEYIFVDDASDDESRAILDKNLEKDCGFSQKVTILTHSVNRGLPVARNTGLAMATGDYIYHCDSDDYLEPDLLSRLIDNAQMTDADIVTCDYYISYREKDCICRQPDCSSGAEAVGLMLQGKMKYNVWNKLVKRSLYEKNHIRFSEGHTMGEDSIMILLYALAGKISTVHLPLYHYVQYNSQSITSRFSMSDISDLIYNTERVVSGLESLQCKIPTTDIAAFRYLMKWPLLVTGKYTDYVMWRTAFPDLERRFITESHVSGRIKFIEHMASRGQWWLIWLHYWIVIRLYYSIAYKLLA